MPKNVDDVRDFKFLIKNLPGDLRQDFISQFDSLDSDDKKQKIMDRVLENRQQFEELSPSIQERKGDGSFISNVGNFLRREEAVGAELLSANAGLVNKALSAAFLPPKVKSGNLLETDAFLETPERSLLEKIGAARRGESESQFEPGRQKDVGDVLQELGLGQGAKAVGGLALSSFLPSSLLFGAVGKGVKEVSKKALGKIATKKAAEKVGKEVTKEFGEKSFRNLFRDLDTKAGKRKRFFAESIESATDTNSDDILFAMDNPDILTNANARPEALDDLAKEVAQASSAAIKKNPDDFFPDEKFIVDKAKEIASEVRAISDEAGSKFRRIQKEVIRRRPEGIIEKGVISRDIKLQMRKQGFLGDGGKVKQLFKDDATYNTLDDLLTSLKNDFPDRPLTLEETIDFQKTISDKAFKRASKSGSIDFKKFSQTESALKGVYSGIRRNIRRTFDTEPQLLQAYDDFSRFANQRGDFKSILKSEKNLASQLRRIDKLPAEQLDDLTRSLDILPNKNKHMNSINRILDLKEDSLANRIPGLSKRTPQSIEKDLATMFKKNFRDMNPIEKDSLDKLDSVLGIGFSKKLVERQVAGVLMNKKANVFRALAAGGAAGLAGGPAAAAAGFAITDPRFQAIMIRETLGKNRALEGFLKGTKSASQNVLKATGASSPALLRRFLSEEGDE